MTIEQQKFNRERLALRAKWGSMGMALATYEYGEGPVQNYVSVVRDMHSAAEEFLATEVFTHRPISGKRGYDVAWGQFEDILRNQ